ncbi:MAG: rhomboid family intramembrane serine protease [Bryobacterales bacterium]|jgi:membrane associated rhomboid family serine protease|nr:rhomboid family intramembrane serine protease [Bryobacterales bacterium]
MATTPTHKRSGSSLQASVQAPLLLAIALWVCFTATILLPFLNLRGLGIAPRSVGGLVGILFAPLLHANLYHLAANTVPLFVLMLLLVLQAGRNWVQPFVLIWLGTGIGTWVIGRGGAVHLGASGIVYGLLTYLIAAGIYHRHWRSMLIAGFVFLTYGGLLWRIFPSTWFVSWESHLCGAVVGVLVASLGRQR